MGHLKKQKMEKIKSLIKTLPKSLAVTVGVIIGALAIALALTTPLILVWGLQLLGLPVSVTWKSYFGAVLVYIFFSGASRLANKKK